jgi:ATP-dependent exoDNAse (exonuclease V) beta subunit
MEFGSEVHAAFEQVGWIDEISPALPGGDAGALVTGLLKIPKLRQLFERGGRSVEHFNEQPVDAILGGKWLSGVMDRLHLHRNTAGVVTRVEVIDFKTDAVDEIGGLVERYSGQMNAYREVMELAYPGAKVECILLSTRWRDWVAV